MPNAPSFKALQPTSPRASRVARSCSKKSGTRCELILRRQLWAMGCRFRVDLEELPGRPDIVFTKARLAIFCDGDFWHGNDWPTRKAKLSRGANPEYWIAKIERNMERDLSVAAELRAQGWIVLRFWESEIRRDPAQICGLILNILDSMQHRRQRPLPHPAANLIDHSQARIFPSG